MDPFKIYNPDNNSDSMKVALAKQFLGSSERICRMRLTSSTDNCKTAKHDI